MTGPVHRIWDTAPADDWQDALLAGNGEYGIMVHGRPWAERIVVNHHRFVLPNGTHDARPPRLAALLPRIRRLILTDRRAEASRLLAGDGVLRWTQSFHPGFALTVDADGGPVHDYRRYTDFDTGEVVVRWAGGSRHSFVSRTDRLIVTRLDMGPCRVGVTGDLPGCPGLRYTVSAYRRDGLVFLRARARYPTAGAGYGFEGLTLLRGAVEIDGDGVRVDGPALLVTVLDRPRDRWRTGALQRRLTGHRDAR
ncbi:glycoside hydrolase N-terminal domain-containing protein [Verrucosispora sioxanthis]|nr:glycoside hydrolase N-terminal domain-containing protein [Verrucosispora sioxanthis]